MAEPALALTLWRPWPFAIFHLPPSEAKPVENRGWKPPASVIGKRIAIHAGKKYDADADDFIFVSQLDIDKVGNDARLKHEGIVGTVLVWGWVQATESMFPESRKLVGFGGRVTEAQALKVIRSRWFCGPYGWVMAERRTLAMPVACKGAQGLWRVPDDVVAKMEVHNG